MDNELKTIPCKVCGEDTHMLGTKLCDTCWESYRNLERLSERIKKEITALLNFGKRELVGYSIVVAGKWDAEHKNVRELLCEMCGRDYPIWSADNELWNAVMRIDGVDDCQFVCPTCFTMQAALLGIEHSFFLSGSK